MREADAIRFHCRGQHVVQERVLLLHQPRRTLVNRSLLFRQGQGVRASIHRAELQALLQARDADLEEFIEIAAGNAEKAHAFEKWQRGVLALIQYPLIELEKAELAVDVELRGLEIRGIHRRGLL